MQQAQLLSSLPVSNFVLCLFTAMINVMITQHHSLDLR